MTKQELKRIEEVLKPIEYKVNCYKPISSLPASSLNKLLNLYLVDKKIYTDIE